MLGVYVLALWAFQPGVLGLAGSILLRACPGFEALISLALGFELHFSSLSSSPKEGGALAPGDPVLDPGSRGCRQKWASDF